MTEALKTLLNYCVVPLVTDESIPLPAIYDPNQMKMAVNPNYGGTEAFAGIAIEIAHVRFHAKGYNQNYSREDYELDAQSVGYMICHRFGVPCEAPTYQIWQRSMTGLTRKIGVRHSVRFRTWHRRSAAALNAQFPHRRAQEI